MVHWGGGGGLLHQIKKINKVLCTELSTEWFIVVFWILNETSVYGAVKNGTLIATSYVF